MSVVTNANINRLKIITITMFLLAIGVSLPIYRYHVVITRECDQVFYAVSEPLLDSATDYSCLDSLLS